MKIVLDDTAGGYNLSVINANFDKIEAALNTGVLWRINPDTTQANSLTQDIDANSVKIYNLPTPTLPSQAARLQDVQNAISGTTAANLITFVPTGQVTSVNVQAAIAEVDTKYRAADTALAAADSAQVTATSLVQTNLTTFITNLAASAGSVLVGFIHSLAGAVATTLQARSRNEVWSTDFGHSTGNTAAQNDTALVAAITAVFNAGGGTIRIPSGVFLHSNVTFNWTAANTVNIRGAGTKATYLQKSGTGAVPLLQLSANTGVLDTYTEIADLTIDGVSKTANAHGLQATTFASVVTRNLAIVRCDVGFNSLGCLGASHYNAAYNSNNVGFKCQKSGAIYANLVSFYSGSVKGNSSFGLDIDNCSNFRLNSTDVETNGTTLVTTTGNVNIRNGMALETGLSIISFDNCWLEASFGSNFVCATQSSGTLNLTMKDVKLAAAEAHLSATIGAIGSVTLIDVEAASPGDTVVIGASSSSTIIGGNINTVTDSSVSRIRLGTSNTGGLVKFGSSTCNFVALVAGTKTISYPALKSNDQVFVTSQADGGSPGWLRVINKTPGVGFTVNSSSLTDTSAIAWFVVEAV